MYDFSQARTNMLDGQIHTAGVIEPLILASFQETPREKFVPESISKIAYNDADIEITDGRYLMDPITHAKMLQSLQINENDVVLDVGCATGYSSAILSNLASMVIAIEEDKSLLDRASNIWSKLGVCNVAGYSSEVVNGYEKNAPYDAIIINGAVSKMPEKIISQLKEDGQLIFNLRRNSVAMGNVTLVTKGKGSEYSSRTVFQAATPYLKGFEPSEEFIL